MLLEYQNAAILYDHGQLKRIRDFLRAELQRSYKSSWVKGHPSIYYLSYLFRNQCMQRLSGRLGAIIDDQHCSQNSVYCDLRVGSYRYDNISEGGLKSNPDRSESTDYVHMPLELNRDAYCFELWRLTDACYREAIEQYYQRKSQGLHYMPQYPELASKVRQKAYKKMQYQNYPSIDKDYWAHLLRKAGYLIKQYRKIKNSWFEFRIHHNQSLFVNSDGSEILQQQQIYELRGHIWLLGPRGEGISQEINLMEGELSNLPSEKEFLAMISYRVDLLLKIAIAPRLNSFSGPALLAPIPSGVFFHEAVGHRLEGTRLLSQEEGATFLDLHKKQIAPEYIDIIDDPSLHKYQNRCMVGHFKYDDEGSLSQKTVLVKRGILKNFLSTSTPLPGQKKLNGHARNQNFQRPVARMGNFFVVNHKPVIGQDMYASLIEEIKKQKKPYGIYIKEIIGGETGTDAYDFQAFKGEVLHAVRVFPNGKEEIIGGVDFVGTPLTALDTVICLGDKPELSNSYCGAESGLIPVSTVAPATLLRSLELQSQNRERFTQYALPLPY